MTTISHWGTDPLCTIGRFNEQPMVTLWNTLVRFKDAEFRGEKPLLYLLQQVEQNNLLDDFLLWSPAWGALLLMIVIFTAVSVFALRKIDKDKR